MTVRNACPACRSAQFKKTGHIHRGKQNHQCKACGRQFVIRAEGRLVGDEHHMLVESLLRERISLRGICCVAGVSLTWLTQFMVERFAACPDHLHLQLPAGPTDVAIRRLDAEADEMWSFVGKKANKQWLCLAMDTTTRQVMAFHVGDRSRKRGERLWAKMPAVYQRRATFHTDVDV
jgi:insertion element IS1 protein InsB